MSENDGLIDSEHNNPNDDGEPWGYIADDIMSWVALPKGPMLREGYGPPPFSIKLPSGEVRRIIHMPKRDPPDETGC